jgi:hypothetical protein
MQLLQPLSQEGNALMLRQKARFNLIPERFHPFACSDLRDGIRIWIIIEADRSVNDHRAA